VTVTAGVVAGEVATGRPGTPGPAAQIVARPPGRISAQDAARRVVAYLGP